MKNKIIQGDCIEELDQLENESFDLVVTDPPYGIEYKSNHSDRFEVLENDDSLAWFEEFVSKTVEVMKEDTAFYCFTRFDVYPEMYRVIENYLDVKNLLVVPTKHFSMGDLEATYSTNFELVIFAMKGRRKFNKENIIRDEFIYRFDSRNESNGFKHRLPALMDFVDATEHNLNLEHPTQKSIDPLEIFIRYHSDEGDLVLDPFLGSGTTAVAAKKNGRDYIGIEKKQKFVDMARKRLIKINSKSDWNKFVNQRSL